MQEIVLAGTSAAASIVTITKVVNDFMEGRVSWREKAEKIKTLNQEVNSLKDNIPMMFRDNENLLGYKDLHKEAQEFLIVVGKLDPLIRNAYEDKSRALAHIEDLHKYTMRVAYPVMDSVMYTVEQKYTFLKEDGAVTRRLYPIHDMFDDMHSRIEMAWENKTTELDKKVKGYLEDLFRNLATLMRYLDDRIKELSEKMKEESKAFENLLRTDEVKEE